MLKFAYFRVFLITFGLLQGPLRSRTSHNMIFGMSFDGLMTSARKRNGSKKSQSLGSEIMCHPMLKVENQIKVTNRSSFNNPFWKRNVISFTMYYNLVPGNMKNCFFSKKPFYSMKSRFLHFLGLYCNRRSHQSLILVRTSCR